MAYWSVSINVRKNDDNKYSSYPTKAFNKLTYIRRVQIFFQTFTGYKLICIIRSHSYTDLILFKVKLNFFYFVILLNFYTRIFLPIRNYHNYRLFSRSIRFSMATKFSKYWLNFSKHIDTFTNDGQYKTQKILKLNLCIHNEGVQQLSYWNECFFRTICLGVTRTQSL